MTKTGAVMEAMIEYYAGDAMRINHFLKVYGFAKVIGEMEGLAEEMQELLEIAALVHDIGIKISEEKYKSAAGQYQELEGPPAARELLDGLGYTGGLAERVCYLVGHHHTYSEIDGLDYQILVEADFLVNIWEEGLKEHAVEQARKKIFKTKSGRILLDKIYPR